MTEKEIEEKIHKMMADGDTEDALNALIEHLKAIDSPYHEAAILLSGRLKQWQRDNMLGVQQSSQELRRIEMSILNLLNGDEAGILESDTSTGATSIAGRNSNNTVIYVVSAIALAAILGLIYVFVIDHQSGDEQAAQTAPTTIEDSSNGNNSNTALNEVITAAEWPAIRYRHKMSPGDTLLQGERFIAGNGSHHLRITSTGDLVVEKIEDEQKRVVQRIYTFPTAGRFPIGDNRPEVSLLSFQKDCNICLILSTGTERCLTNGQDELAGIYDPSQECSNTLEMQDNGELTLFSAEGVELWSSAEE